MIYFVKFMVSRKYGAVVAPKGTLEIERSISVFAAILIQVSCKLLP